MAKNLPANAENTGSIPDPGTGISQGSWSRVPQLLSSHAASYRSPSAREPARCSRRSRSDEKAPRRNEKALRPVKSSAAGKKGLKAESWILNNSFLF